MIDVKKFICLVCHDIGFIFRITSVIRNRNAFNIPVMDGFYDKCRACNK